MKPGWIVKTPDSRAIGKVSEVWTREATVSYFLSISLCETQRFARNSLERVNLCPQTRVFFREGNDVWRAARVEGAIEEKNDSTTYEVRFPNGRTRFLPEDQLFVRCMTALQDPSETLAVRGCESQFLHDPRWIAVKRLTECRAAAQGMDALTSSAIELVPHQIAAVRRILQDTRQRYLLADEVGLGKTIEAGVVIRQCLLDDADRRVCILVPQPLVQAWKAELESRFGAEQFGEAVQVVPYEDAISLAREPFDMVVVDEAHQVIGQTEQCTQTDDVSAAIRKMAQVSPRLLLLSATPPLGHEATLLGLLNLLDPEVYRLEDRESFVLKVTQRQEYGKLLLGLRLGASPFVLKQRATSVKNQFRDDPLALQLADNLLSALATSGDSVATACIALRQHIAETYRIHHRLIRSRRIELEEWAAPRGPVPPENGLPELRHVVLESDEDERIESLAQCLEDWREAALTTVPFEEESVLTRLLATKFKRLCESLGIGIEAFRQEIMPRESLFAGEDIILAEMNRVLHSDPGGRRRHKVAGDSLEQLRRFLQKHEPQNKLCKVVLFSSNAIEAQGLYHDLSLRFGADAILSGISDNSDAIEESGTHLAQLFQEDEHAWILVCDSSGEEGLNLQFADAIFHMDLPWAAGRLEQRIGRLDRFGRKKQGIRHRILLPTDEDSSVWAAWYRLLSEGFLLFNQSISDVQFVLDQIDVQISLALYQMGSNGLLQLIPHVRQRLIEERERLDQQYALEQVALAQDDTKTIVDALEQAEDNEGKFATEVGHFLRDVLLFHFWYDRRGNFDVFELRWSERTLVPRLPWMIEFKAGIHCPVTWKRRLAVHRNQVSLLRPGAPFIDTLMRFLRWDDRGTSFITWRIEPGFGGPDDLWTGFRLCYVIEAGYADTAPFGESADREGLRRRALSFFPPTTAELYLDSGLTEVTDERLLTILRRPYSKRRNSSAGEPEARDINLGSRLPTLEAVIDAPSFARLCQKARASSEQKLRKSNLFQQHHLDAVSRARRELEQRNQRLILRRDAEQRAGSRLDPSILAEIKWNAAVLEAVERPTIRLEAIGFFVVAGVAPTIEGDD